MTRIFTDIPFYESVLRAVIGIIVYRVCERIPELWRKFNDKYGLFY